MGGWYGWRLVCVVALLALGCRVGLAQIGPRYVLELPAARHGQRAPEQGSITLEPDGQATIRVHGLTVALVGPDGGAGQPDLAVLSLRHPMRAWDTLYLRKGQARLRVTAMPGGPGTVDTAGFLLEIGTFHATGRIYVSCAPLAAGELAALFQRLPGAELVLAPAGDGQAMALLRRAGNQDLFVPVAAPGGRYPFVLLRR